MMIDGLIISRSSYNKRKTKNNNSTTSRNNHHLSSRRLHVYPRKRKCGTGLPSPLLLAPTGRFLSYPCIRRKVLTRLWVNRREACFASLKSRGIVGEEALLAPVDDADGWSPPSQISASIYLGECS